MNMNHIHLNSPHLGQSLEFYQTYFGMRRKDCGPNAPRFLEDDAGFLMAMSEIKEPVELPPWFHLGFAKQQAETVRALYEKMKADGVEIAKDLIDEDDCVAFWCRDPAGYKVEVSWFPSNF